MIAKSIPLTGAFQNNVNLIDTFRVFCTLYFRKVRSEHTNMLNLDKCDLNVHMIRCLQLKDMCNSFIQNFFKFASMLNASCSNTQFRLKLLGDIYVDQL